MDIRLRSDCAGAHAPGAEELPHGTHCECRQLAAAVGLRPQALSYFYCRTTLQRRWCMTCRHGVVEAGHPTTSGSERWTPSGRLTTVLAILIRNA